MGNAIDLDEADNYDKIDKTRQRHCALQVHRLTVLPIFCVTAAQNVFGDFALFLVAHARHATAD
jgi:hypothetical protein